MLIMGCNKKFMCYIWLILAIVCLGYYIVCVSYAGIGSSFIFIWMLGACFFALIFLVTLLDMKNIIMIPAIIKKTFFVIFGMGVILFITLETLITISMKQTPPDGCDYIIVLGCQIRGDRITKSLKHRLDAAYNYAVKNEDTIIIVSGGQGKGENKTEALAMYEYLIGRGIEKERILMEDKSTDTNENMSYSIRYIEDKDALVGIVTNNFHLFRSKLLAKAKGLNNVCGISSPSDEILFINYMVREAIGIMKDFCIGNFFR